MYDYDSDEFYPVSEASDAAAEDSPKKEESLEPVMFKKKEYLFKAANRVNVSVTVSKETEHS